MLLKWLLLISSLCYVSLQAENPAVGPTSFNPHLVLNNNGDALVAWNTGGNIGGAIQYAFYDKKGQNFGTISTMAETGSSSEHVTLALNNQQDALMLWDTTVGQIYYSVYDKSSKKMETARQISKTSVNSMNPNIAFNDQGDGIAVWSNAEGEVQYATYHKIDRRFGSANTFRGAKTSLNAQVVMNNIGQAMIVWYDSVKTAIRYVVCDKMKFGQIQTIANTKEAINQVIALNDASEAMIVWNTGAQTTLSGEVQCVIYDKESSSFGSLQTIANGKNAFPVISLNKMGEAIVTWSRMTADGKQPIWYAVYDKASKHFKTPKAIKKAITYSIAPQVSLNSKGEAILTWFTTTNGTIQYAIYDKSIGLFAKAKTIKGTEANSEYPMVALNEHGQAILIWSSFGAIQYSIYDKVNSTFGLLKKI